MAFHRTTPIHDNGWLDVYSPPEGDVSHVSVFDYETNEFSGLYDNNGVPLFRNRNRTIGFDL